MKSLNAINAEKKQKMKRERLRIRQTTIKPTPKIVIKTKDEYDALALMMEAMQYHQTFLRRNTTSEKGVNYYEAFLKIQEQFNKIDRDSLKDE
jgi:hypothetical protein